MLGAILKAVLEGVTTGLYPIGLVIVAALFTYAVTVETGGIIRRGFSKISDDMRVMALLVVWGLGNFMEGMAGFGTAAGLLKHERVVFHKAIAYFVPVLLLACVVTFAFVMKV